MRKLLKDNRGIALLLVLSSLALLSGMVVEFAYNAHVTFNLAFNQKERTQAYYLAESGIQFSRLIISYDKEARKLAEQAGKKLGKNVQIPPLYEMIPVNSALIRGIAGIGEEGEGGEGEAKTEKGEAEGEGAEGLDVDKKGEGDKQDAAEQAINVFDIKGAESFLAFEGDFASEIQEEDSKINVNAFLNFSPTQKEFDRLKSMLYHLLLTDEFKGLFEDRFRGAKELSQNIADYVDRDDSVHEGGEERGREGVAGGQQAKMKNGKLLTVEELIMVPGMTDAILAKLKPYLTVYGKDDKILLCRAAEPVVTAVVLAYTDSNPNKMEPLKDDNTELVTKARDAVLNSCPDAVAMASELDKVLGVETPETDSSGGSQSETQPVLKGKTSPGAPGTGTTAAVTLESMIKKQADIFRITGIGTVGDTEVRLKTVIDTSGGSSKSWKELYWRVE